ncbi:MAG: ATP-binding protein [Acidobacteriota bacterium]
MRLSIRARQIVAVTAIVCLAAAALGALYVSDVARVRLEASRATGELLANAIYHRARDAVVGARDPLAALHDDPGLHSILESSAYSPNVTYAAIVDRDNTVIAHGDAHQVGTTLPARSSLEDLLSSGAWTQLRTIFAGRTMTLEITKPLLMGDERFGTIRIGVSMLLTRADLEKAIRPAVTTVVLAVVLASLVAMLTARSLLRPVHLLRAGLSRVGRGGHGDPLGLSAREEPGEFGGIASAGEPLPADGTVPDLTHVSFDAIVTGLEDAVALFDLHGTLLFANEPMRTHLGPGAEGANVAKMWRPDDLRRQLVEATGADGAARGPLPASSAGRDGAATRASLARGAGATQLMRADAVRRDPDTISGVLLVIRPLGYLHAVDAALRRARRMSTFSRLSAGVAHELKNPLNAISIHLELLRQIVTGESRGSVGANPTDASGRPSATAHLNVIGTALQRLDEVLQGYLKFIRPEHLTIESVSVASLFDDLLPIVRAEARRSGIEVVSHCPPGLASLFGDRGMLHQALLNLALNACQAMPDGGRLSLTARPAGSGQIEISVEDTGTGIPPEHLNKVFDLYFTTRSGGSGVGLSLVYRTVQLHDGEIEVDSSPGRGTVFRILLPAAAEDEHVPRTGS